MSEMDPETLRRFDEASSHPFNCDCELCKEWWELVPQFEEWWEEDDEVSSERERALVEAIEKQARERRTNA